MMASMLMRHMNMDGNDNRMKILLVEDSEAIRGRLRNLIGEIGKDAVISEASSELDAVENACRSQPDLVILDLKLAQGNGLGVLQSVRRCSPQTRIAVLTSHAEGPYRKKCLEMGAEWFLDKARGFEGVKQVLGNMGLVSVNGKREDREGIK